MSEKLPLATRLRLRRIEHMVAHPRPDHGDQLPQVHSDTAVWLSDRAILQKS